MTFLQYISESVTIAVDIHMHKIFTNEIILTKVKYSKTQLCILYESVISHLAK